MKTIQQLVNESVNNIQLMAGQPGVQETEVVKVELKAILERLHMMVGQEVFISLLPV
jgi:hypothetical protein